MKHLVQAGMPLLYIATALGRRTARMVERHYGHFSPSQVAETIRANLPAFGVATPRKVRSTGSRRTSLSDSNQARARWGESQETLTRLARRHFQGRVKGRHHGIEST